MGSLRPLSYKIAREFVEEQAMGEWDDEQIAKDARALAATLDAYATDCVVHEGAPTPRMVCIVPVGWKLVPVEATPDMLTAGAAENVDAEREGLIFGAMLSSAPEPPLPAQGLLEALSLPEGEWLRNLVRELKRADIADSREKLAELCWNAATTVQIQQAAIENLKACKRVEGGDGR